MHIHVDALSPRCPVVGDLVRSTLTVTHTTKPQCTCTVPSVSEGEVVGDPVYWL